MSMILDIGCGSNKLENAIGLDSREYGEVDIVFDLETLADGEKLPFPDERFDRVECRQVLEHIAPGEPTIALFEEVYRVLKPAGIFHIEVPYYKRETAFASPDHKQFFTENTFYYFDCTEQGFSEVREYLDACFKVERQRLVRNWSCGRAPHPLKFWKIEGIHANLKKIPEVNTNLSGDE